jgi:hypothetical protein
MDVIVGEWVLSSQVVVPVSLLTVHGHVHVDGASTLVGGPLWLPALPEGSTCPSGEAETRRRGSSAFDDAAGARARWRDVAQDAYHARGLSARLGRDRVCHSRHERLTCCQCFLGPLRWADLTNVQGAIFYPLLGTLSILIPNNSQGEVCKLQDEER